MKCSAPVSDVRITSITADGDVSTVDGDGGDVYLQEGSRRGVGCVVTTDGSRTPANVSVTVDDRNLTSHFNASTEVDRPYY